MSPAGRGLGRKGRGLGRLWALQNRAGQKGVRLWEGKKKKGIKSHRGLKRFIRCITAGDSELNKQQSDKYNKPSPEIPVETPTPLRLGDVLRYLTK